MEGLTRRIFVKRSGVFLGTSAIVGWHGATAVAGTSRSLSSTRRNTYAALVGAVAAANALPADAAGVSSATASFERWYAGELDGTRLCVETVLDELESSDAGFFTQMDGPKRLELLRRWRDAPGVTGVPNASAKSLRQHIVAYHALNFASPPYGATRVKPSPLPI